MVQWDATDGAAASAGEARARFAALARLPDEQLPLAEAALWIAAEAVPGLDVAHYLCELDALAERARQVVEAGADDRQRVRLLNHALFVSEGFAGNRSEYHDPRNSFLNEVLDRRTGIPITLALVYVEVARRLGLDADGVGFPGHFLAKVATDGGDVLVDAFFGRTLSEAECAERLQHLAGEGARFERSLLRAARPREILQRMLTNLKHVYAARRELEAALACSERILLLAPDAPLELRDRGLLYRELECPGAALADLERFLAAAGQHPSAAAIRELLPELRARARRLH